MVTSLGFGMLGYTDYVEAVRKLRPDIVVGMGDVLFGHKPGVKRADRMGDRTLAWINELVAGMEDGEEGTPNTALFAPILPIEAEQQSYYLDTLGDELMYFVSGFALYDLASVNAIPENMSHLPRLHLGEANSPQKLLHAIVLGVDIFTVPFITEATDAGIALDFSFPAVKERLSHPPIPLGKDMWSESFATSLKPLRSGCGCHACVNHHCAFVQHLLSAKEMLGWVLLQLHNHHIIDQFFAGVRHSISSGSFEIDTRVFENCYTADLPEKSGQGPR